MELNKKTGMVSVPYDRYEALLSAESKLELSSDYIIKLTNDYSFYKTRYEMLTERLHLLLQITEDNKQLNNKMENENGKY